MELSIIIPSIRPAYLKNLLWSIKAHTRGIEYEVLLNNEAGILYEIINKEFSKAKGRYVFLTCDEAKVHGEWARRMIDFLDKEDPMTIGNFNFASDDRGSSRPMDIRYYGKLCSIHPFLRRESVKGDFFNPRLKRFYGDIDLSLRFWSIGGQVKTCSGADITMYNNRDRIKKEALSTYEKLDEEEFKKKWENYDFTMLSDKKETRAV